MKPDEVQGELKAQLMQLLMAASHPASTWMERVAGLLGDLPSLVPSGGINYVRIFVLYILATQEPEAARLFGEVLRQYAPEVGDDLMTYAQELVKEGREEGREEGRLEERVKMIEGLLRAGAEWSLIEEATSINEVQFEALQKQVEDRNG